MNELDGIRRQLRYLMAWTAIVTLALATMVVLLVDARRGDRFTSIRVERIEIVDAEGKIRMLLTGPQWMPGPAGPRDDRPNARKFVAPAIIFYDESEHEYGGLVPRARTGDTSLTAMIFDYSKSEAGGFFTQQKDDDTGFAALMINDPPPASMSQKEAIQKNWNRIRIMNPNRNAEIVLSDSKGKDRIQLRVTDDDDAYFEILDPAGEVVFRAPPAGAQPSTDRWLGQWNGPEGTLLRLEGGEGKYKITIRDLDGARTYQGSAIGDRIHFERDGVRESIRATNGAETGMKWLSAKSNCLTIRAGEGYCRD